MTVSVTTTASTQKISTHDSCYGSPYLVDCYDSWISAREDVPFLVEVLHKQLAQCELPAGTSFCFLDIGTGTGRILRSLATTFEQRPSRAISLIGLDNEPHMLDRAKQLQLGVATPAGVTVTWTLGSALELSTVFPFSNSSKTKVDLAVFAFGSISHFTEPGQAEKFFAELAKVLRPGTGLAYVPILKSFLVDDAAAVQALADAAPYHSPAVHSKLYPGIVYQENLLEHGVKGNNAWRSRSFEVIKDGEVIERKVDDLLLRLWKTEEIRGLAAQAGLVGVDRQTVGDEIFFVFQLPM